MLNEAFLEKNMDRNKVKLAEALVTPDLAEALVPHELAATPETPDLAEAPVPIEPTEPC